MKESLSKKGHVQGDMAPKVEDFAAPEGIFGGETFSKTTDYVERTNATQKKAASDIKKQAYKGRYS
jgi:hypothetical protein